MTLIDLEPTGFAGLNKLENDLVNLLLENEAKTVKLTNAEMADMLHISESYFYQLKRKSAVSEVLLAQTKLVAKQLLTLAVSKSRELLEDDAVSPSAKATLIGQILKSNQLYSDQTEAEKQASKPQNVDIDSLLEAYGIKKKA